MTDTRRLQKGFVLIVPALLFGLLVAAQWGTFAGSARDDVAIRYVEPLNSSVGALQAEQDLLKGQLARLRAELDELQRTATTQTGATRELQQRLDSLRALAGLTEVTGDGLLVTFDLPPPAEAERPACLAPDLTDITNVAWRAGATAVSINGERVVGSSSVYCVGSTIVVNGTLTSAPFQIKVVGDGTRLLAAFEDPQNLRDLKRRRDERSVILRASREAAIVVPSYSGPIAIRAATVE